MNGIDVSATGQGTIDYDQLPPTVEFVIAKATEGSGFIDPQFVHNWTETKRTGRRRGAYHFAVPDLGSSAQDEARHFLSILGPLDGDDLLALDYERDWTGDVVGWCRQWLELVRSVTGITPYIYLNLYLSHVYDWGSIEQPGGFPLWLADYDGLPEKVIETPWPSVAIKQYTSSGTLPGIAGLVDLNVMEDGMPTEEQIREWAKQETRAVLKAEYGIDQGKVPAVVAETEALYHHVHEDPATASLTTQPILVPFDAAVFEGSSAPLPDGTVQVAAWMSRKADGSWVFYDAAGKQLA